MTTRRLLALSLPVIAAAALLSACGPQTDDRVSPSAEASIAVESAAPTSDAASPAPVESAAPQPTAAVAGLITANCQTGEQTAVTAAPEGTTVGAFTAAIGADGVPTITTAVGSPTATELGIADLVEGDGAEAKAGDTLTVNYCGVGLSNGAVFDSSWASGQPATFPLNGLIAGWQQGLPGMKVGGTRLLVIPAELGYGDQGAGAIPPGETLAFVVELQSATAG